MRQDDIDSPFRGWSPVKAKSWSDLAGATAVIAFMSIALALRLHNLGDPFPRDGDEGVYWQTLRALSHGGALYRDIFYAQPPFFIEGVRVFYVLGGETLWAARFAIVMFSMVGMFGAYLLGRTLGGWRGAALAVILAALDTSYLAESQTLQAEAPQLGLSLLAVAMAYRWTEATSRAARYGAAALCGAALALGILSKLFGLAACVPVLMLILSPRHGSDARATQGASILIGLGVFIATAIAVLAPFIPEGAALWQDMVGYHLTAATLFEQSYGGNLAAVARFLAHSGTAYVAGFGLVMATLLREWRALPLVAWLLATIALLVHQVPLFPHHLVALIPPLLGVSALAASGGVSSAEPIVQQRRWRLSYSAIALCILGVVGAADLNELKVSYAQHKASATHLRQAIAYVAQQLRAAVGPQQHVVTDAPFIAAMADRDPLPGMVDMSLVRLSTQSLTTADLLAAAERSEVGAVLFLSNAGILAEQGEFYRWVSQHYRLSQRFSPDDPGLRELWVKS